MQRAIREKSKDWGFDAMVRDGFSYKDQIAAAEQHIADFQTAYDDDEQTLKEMGVKTKPSVSSDDCLRIDPADKSAVAVVCNQNTQKAAILMAEGILDLLHCRAGLTPAQSAPRSVSQPPSANKN